VTLDGTELERLIHAAGYELTTPVAVGVGSGSTTVVATHGGSLGRTFDADSVGYSGSIAKQVTGACAVLLERDGTLDVEAPIMESLPELPQWAASIRVRHLIHHTAGLPATDAIWERMEAVGERDWTSDGVFRALAELRPSRPPGEVYEYSNAGYVLLARIVERLSGRGLAVVASERLFRPLGLGATSFWAGPAPSPPAAVLARPMQPPAPLSLGDGGLWTSVRDLLGWNAALLSDTLGVEGLLHRTGSLDDGTPLDYAWGVRVAVEAGKLVQSHGGSWETSAAKLVRLPALGLSFAIQAQDGSVERMTALASSVQHALLSGGSWDGR
jgi:CubicO group peptidase (beta-lactamase class C family)